MSRVLVTPRSITKAGGHPSLDRLTAAGYEVRFSAPGKLPAQEELQDLLQGCAGYLAGVEPVTEELLGGLPELRVISRNGTGVDSIDLQAAERHGVRVCRAKAANAQGVAELTIGMLFALARSIPAHDAGLKGSAWERHAGVELHDRTLGVVGCGAIGQRVTRMALGVGMKVQAYDVQQDPGFAPGASFTYASLDAVFASSDFVTLHCPPPKGCALVTAAVLSGMPKGAYLINTARAGLVDEAAILAALDNGQLAGYATDVFAEEPPHDWTLCQHPRIIATPHVGGYTSESVDRSMEVAVDNLLTHLEKTQ